ncbi:MAG: hypothetical protein U1E45_03615 [Geminicoccaceae bacterium]
MNRHALPEAVERRRTLAIIWHPDAGKTTRTEKLLLRLGEHDLRGIARACAVYTLSEG